MASDTQTPSADTVQPARGLELVSTLSNRIDRLLHRCHELQLENDALNSERSRWLTERQELINKCKLAEDGIDKTIERLERIEDLVKST
ncbi:MAG: hypothetical protein OXC80_07375 [Gammaproteobacteria bacterium]|nr:hypothetical protein [Gammaproteobacteria bacterium]